MSVTVTLVFATAVQAHEALGLLAEKRLSYADRPDVGVELLPPLVPVPAAPGNPFAPPPAGQVMATVAAIATAAATPVNPFADAIATVSLPTAPAAPASPAVPVSGVELDTKGLPWDGRIHGSTQTKNTDGSWRQKRGLNDEALKLRVEAELRAGQAARAPAAAGITTMPASIVTPLVPNVPAAPVASVAPAVAATAIAPAAPAAPAAGETFGQLMARLAMMTTGEPAKAEKLNQALGMFGLTAIAQLASRPDLVTPFATTIDAMLAVPA